MLERSMIRQGEERYRESVRVAQENNRASDTSYARRLTASLCTDVATSLDAWIKDTGPCKGAYARVVLRKLDTEQSAFITMKTIFDCLVSEQSLLTTALLIGQRIEDQVRFSVFEENFPDLYRHIVKDFAARNTVSYRRKHAVLTNAHNRHEEYKGLTSNQRGQLGAVLIDHAIKATGLFDVKLVRLPGMKSTKVLYATDETLEWINEHINQFALLYPDFSPTVLPPKPWVSMYNGGYYLRSLQQRFPFVKAKTPIQREGIQGHDWKVPMDAVNKLQETGWRVNQFVLKTMQEAWRNNLGIGMPPSEKLQPSPCPFPKDLNKKDMTNEQREVFNYWKKECSDIYTAERKRVSKCLLLGRIFSSAARYSKYEAFYFVYNTDFRGRIYAASSGFSPQGPDISKGILEFSTGKALGATGFRWLCIHGSNTYGNDKVPFDARVDWCLERTELLVSIAKDPFSREARNLWSGADKPYQFLAFCREFAGAIKDKEGFVSHLPIALDGSCNGLQHFSAMLRDEVGGKAVNLMPGDKPEDIYQEVANVAITKLRLRLPSEVHARKALAFGIDRKITKDPVMTVPYGSTMRNCLRKTTEYVTNNIERSQWADTPDMYKGTAYLGKVIWGSIDDVVIAARAAMKWLRKVSNILSKQNYPIVYVTPSGFKMFQSIMVPKIKRVKTQLLGTVELWMRVDTNKIHAHKQANGVSPNFVHSLDASHLTMTVNASDFDSYAMIHDSYGTHACDTDELAWILREQFVRLYTENDVLQDLKDDLEERYNLELPDLPPKGSLILEDVRKSKYFFG